MWRATARFPSPRPAAATTARWPASLPIPTEEDIRAAIARWFHGEERRRVASDPECSDPETLADILKTDEAHLAGDDGWMLAKRLLPEVLRSFGLGNPPPATASFALRLMQSALVEGVQRERERVEGITLPRPADWGFAGITGWSPPPPPPQPASITFGELCDSYLEAPERVGIAPKTKLKYQGMFRVMRDLLGANTPAAAITREDCRRAQALLMAMPANSAQRFKGMDAKAVAEKAKREGIAPMHPNTVGNHLETLAALYKWGMKEKVVRLPDGNPAEGLHTVTAKTVIATAGEKRRPFTMGELRAIFSAPLYTGCKDDEAGYDKPGPNRPRRGRFWVPLLGLWAGVRLNEACQLHTADVAEVDGVPVLLIRASAEGQRLKTVAADRRIPVHPELVRIGFLAHVARQRKTGSDRLFPELPVGALGNYSDAFSKWFARFLGKAGVTSPGAVFHSFRHGFRDRMLEAGLPSEVVDALGGWVTAGQAAAYGSGFSIPTLAGYVTKISYPGLGLSHLHPTDMG